MGPAVAELPPQAPDLNGIQSYFLLWLKSANITPSVEKLARKHLLVRRASNGCEDGSQSRPVNWTPTSAAAAHPARRHRPERAF